MHNPVDIPAHTINPEYMEFWDEFAVAQLSRDNSPIRQSESDRFIEQCSKNASNLRHAKNEMHESQTPASVERWYKHLGTTNELIGAEEDITQAMSFLAKSEEVKHNPNKIFMLYGKLAHERALIGSGEDAEGHFAIASKAYKHIIADNEGDVSNPVVREAYAHLFDATFARLSQARNDGLINQVEFDARYMSCHIEFVQKAAEIARSDIGNGELYEWYGELMLRHRIWAEERFGQIEVRRTFSPREDKPSDGFRMGGRHVNQNGMLPAYAADLKVTITDGSEEPRFVQLKSDKDDYGRYANPPVVVLKYEHDKPLRQHMGEMVGIMLKSYRFEETLTEDELLTEAEHAFDKTGV